MTCTRFVILCLCTRSVFPCLLNNSKSVICLTSLLNQFNSVRYQIALTFVLIFRSNSFPRQWWKRRQSFPVLYDNKSVTSKKNHSFIWMCGFFPHLLHIDNKLEIQRVLWHRGLFQWQIQNFFDKGGGVEKRDPRVNVATCPNIWIMVNVVLIAKNSLGALWIHPCWFKHISVCWQLSAYLCIYGYALLLGVGEGVFVSWRWEFFEVMWVFFISKLAIHSWWPLRKVPVTLSPTFHRFLLHFFVLIFVLHFPALAIRFELWNIVFLNFSWFSFQFLYLL